MNRDHLNILRQGVDAWNAWRREEHSIKPDLSGADLSGADLFEANLFWANLGRTNLSGANLSGAYLVGTNLSKANLRGANLRRAGLNMLTLVGANISGADLTGCRIYGISAWGLTIDEHTQQQNLIITPYGEPEITVDKIEVAQFVYLLLHNEKIRDIIDTIGKKAVLILGRFTEERKRVLDALRDELRKHDYLPILFDFDFVESNFVASAVIELGGARALMRGHGLGIFERSTGLKIRRNAGCANSAVRSHRIRSTYATPPEPVAAGPTNCSKLAPPKATNARTRLLTGTSCHLCGCSSPSEKAH